MSNLNTTHTGAIDEMLPTKSAMRDKVEATRRQVKNAQRAVSINEGRFLDHTSAEELWRTLEAAARNLSELAITLAVAERKAGNNG